MPKTKLLPEHGQTTCADLSSALTSLHRQKTDETKTSLGQHAKIHASILAVLSPLSNLPGRRGNVLLFFWSKGDTPVTSAARNEGGIGVMLLPTA
jgi:hypothetical protein